ncbi:MAG: DNA-formamidopyrimidine glycosylase, partial [Hyphomicrobiales bacterium]
MPELPEVETVRRGLEPAMLGQRFARIEQNRPDLRFPLPDRFVEQLTGRRIEALSRRAKYLIADLDDGQALIMHLGMSGRFVVEAPGTPPVEPGAYYNEIGRHLIHDHVVFHMGSGARVTYNDVRRFGFMDLVPRAELAASKHFAGMGIEPLGNELSGETLAGLFAGKVAPLKAVLLNQRLVAGLGNIYV